MHYAGLMKEDDVGQSSINILVVSVFPRWTFMRCLAKSHWPRIESFSDLCLQN